MKVITLASGSKGNSTLIQTNNVKILVDLGISINEVEEKLNMLGVSPTEIFAILITHEHSDHIKNVGVFARKYNTKIYASNSEWQALEKKIGKISNEQKIAFNDNFYIGDLTINSFVLPHDCNQCLGYSFYNQGIKVSIATDFGAPSKYILDNLKESNLLILEANHDENLLKQNPKYSSILKQRILSSKGHISNLTCASIIENIYSTSLKQVILAHLSEENNNPKLAYMTIKNKLNECGIIEGKNIFIDVASQHNIGHIFELK